MKVQSRYVEYIGDKRVCEGKWFNYWSAKGCPKGCLEIGMTLKDAREWKKKFESIDKKAGCSNFEYRVTI